MGCVCSVSSRHAPAPPPPSIVHAPAPPSIVTVGCFPETLVSETPAPPSISSDSRLTLRSVPRRKKEFILCVGNPGAGKSTLLNSMVGKPVFESGFSAGCGLTQDFLVYVHDGVHYLDTPGLADAAGRPRAAEAIGAAFQGKGSYKILFVITLEAGHMRPQDRATMELVLEAVNPEVMDQKFAVVVNKVSKQDITRLQQNAWKPKLFAENKIVEHVFFLDEDNAIEDERGMLLSLSDDFKSFIAHLPSVSIASGDVAEIQYDKFEQRISQLTQEIQALEEKNKELREQLKAMYKKPEVVEEIAGECEEQEAGKCRFQRSSTLMSPHKVEEAIANFEAGDGVICLEKLGGAAKDVIQAGERGLVVSVSNERSGKRMQKVAHIDFASRGFMIDESEFGKFCDVSQEATIKRNTVRELAHRGVSLGRLLGFYEHLMQGNLPMKDFQRNRSTTANVVKAAIIPLTKTNGQGVSYAELVHPNGLFATRMVSHHWNNLFVHLLAAIVADALDVPIYEEILERLRLENIWVLKRDLRALGKMNIVYWVCAFSVNQHRSICKGFARCLCDTTVHGNLSPKCEMNKFDAMLEYMEDAGLECHVIAIDVSGDVFFRAWVIAELVATTIMDSRTLEQKFKAFAPDALDTLKERTNNKGVNIFDCEASRPEDAVQIKAAAKELMAKKGYSSEQFHRILNERIFAIIEATREAIKIMKREHILCIGNPGVGTTTIINMMIGRQAFTTNKTTRLREHQDDNRIFLEAPGLADTKAREHAAQQITQALLKDGQYKIFFIITLESGRVRPEDKETIMLVLEAAPIWENYSIIINKATPEAIRMFRKKEKLEAIKDQLFSGFALPLLPTDCVWWVEKNGAPHLPNGLLEDSPSIEIKVGRVKNVNGETLEKKDKRFQAERDDLNGVNDFLVNELRKLEKIEEHELKVKAIEWHRAHTTDNEYFRPTVLQSVLRTNALCTGDGCTSFQPSQPKIAWKPIGA